MQMAEASSLLLQLVESYSEVIKLVDDGKHVTAWEYISHYGSRR